MQSLADEFRKLPRAERLKRLGRLTPEQATALRYRWEFWARPNQLPPLEFKNGTKTYWLVKAGRGFGKTRIGAEMVRGWARDFRYVNLIGATVDDARDIMVEGESGILAICPRDERPIYQKGERKLKWPSGCVSLIFTADEPERLRGKQHEKLWADEIAAWRYKESWDQAQFGLRLGPLPQSVITSTPKPTELVRELVANPACVVTNGTTYDNRVNLAPSFYTQIIRKYEGTRLGRQELDAELLTDNPGALFTHTLIDAARVTRLPLLKRIVVGVDPAASNNEDSDEHGLIAAGVDDQWPEHYYVFDDGSMQGSPDEWTKKAVAMYHQHRADRIVAEVNNGGDMVESVLRTKDLNLAYKAVHATRGKVVRAEPISALYEQGRVHHVGTFGTLEDQMCDYNPMTSTASPDRMDALVWAITELSDSAFGGTVFKDFWTPECQYDDATRPMRLGNAGGYVSRFIVASYGAGQTVCFVELLDDGTVLWADRELIWEPVRQAGQKALSQQGAALEEFIQTRRDTEVLVASNASGLQSELTRRGIWFNSLEDKDEEAKLLSGIRTAQQLMQQTKLKVHQRCRTLLSQLGMYSWDQKKSALGYTVPVAGNDHAVAPVMLAIEAKIPDWRLL